MQVLDSGSFHKWFADTYDVSSGRDLLRSETYVLDASFDPDAFVADVKAAKARRWMRKAKGPIGFRHVETDLTRMPEEAFSLHCRPGCSPSRRTPIIRSTLETRHSLGRFWGAWWGVRAATRAGLGNSSQLAGVLGCLAGGAGWQPAPG